MSYFNSIKVRLELNLSIILTRLSFYFNSIKVRLELLNVYVLNLFELNFNSIKVRLELCIVIIRIVAAPFQFHKGTIRTAYEQKQQFLIH